MKELAKSGESFMNIYPNPNSNGQLLVSYKFDNRETVELVITDILGKIVLKRHVVDTDNSKQAILALQLSDYSMHTGIYIVTLTNNSKSFNQKLIVE